MISLRPLEPADAAVVASWIDGLDALVLWSGKAGFTWPFDAGQLLAFRAADPARRLLVADGPGGRPIGHVMLRPDAAPGAVRLGLVLVAPEARGRGHGEALVRAALGAAFADPGAARVTLGVYAHNHGARRLYERLGFREEAVHADSVEVGERRWTSVTMVLPRPR
ncbi:GNAT family N-acetyltransferase [Actinomadura sp. ATCC 31491]|uniref:GNAT family N-acetyltransferase n=1 Tax=Actinomadura luzonensis TaxID=2805427 RepID=A0ABT0FU67_9ACTN|nr:GNAT family protein [Actinomadura luzonensis]MCK2215718.1 GNAT family N-acetyltransferase [Actinomadura luzonensis]